MKINDIIVPSDPFEALALCEAKSHVNYAVARRAGCGGKDYNLDRLV